MESEERRIFPGASPQPALYVEVMSRGHPRSAGAPGITLCEVQPRYRVSTMCTKASDGTIRDHSRASSVDGEPVGIKG